MLSYISIIRALGDENRLRILMALRQRPLCVCEITTLVGLAASTTSKHLCILRQARLIESIKNGRWVYYRLPQTPAPGVRDALSLLAEGLPDSVRLARLRIRLQDQPGALYNVARIFDQERINIIEIYHQRVFTTLPAKGLITDIECEARDKAHLDRLIAALRAAGYETSTVELA